MGVTILGERLEPTGVVGVVALLAGILLVQRPWRVVGVIRAHLARSRRAPGSGDPSAASLVGAAEFAILTGVMIAGYSAVDSVGARQAPIWLYAAVVFPVCAVAMVAWVRLVARRPGRLAAADPVGPAPWLRAGAAGTISLGAYGLILIAYTLAPLTAIAPLRESSVVIASAWGALRMGEGVDARDRARRLTGAGLVLLGAVLLAL